MNNELEFARFSITQVDCEMCQADGPLYALRRKPLYEGEGVDWPIVMNLCEKCVGDLGIAVTGIQEMIAFSRGEGEA